MEKILSHLWEKTKQDPWTYLTWYAVGKPATLWEWSLLEGQGDIFLYPVLGTPYYDNRLFQFTRSLSLFIYYPVVLSTLIYLGLRLLRPAWLDRIGLKDRFRLDLMLGVLVYFTVFHSLLSPYQRYSIPFRILLFPIGLGLLLKAVARLSPVCGAR